MDVLINCAGISQTTLLKRTPDEELASIVDTNLLATMLVCKHAKVRPNGMYTRTQHHDMYLASLCTLTTGRLHHQRFQPHGYKNGPWCHCILRLQSRRSRYVRICMIHSSFLHILSTRLFFLAGCLFLHYIGDPLVPIANLANV